MRILIINPNSNCAFSDQMDKALQPLRAGEHHIIACTSLKDTPRGIETQRDIDAVIDPVCACIQAEETKTDAFVIACFADTGVFSAREMTTKPVIGICEAGLATALNTGERFGILSTSSAARNAELRLIRSHGLLERCVGLTPLDIPVVDLLTHPETRDRLFASARQLIADGADCLVLGCAGMSIYRKELQQELGIPVIDPTIAATAMALGLAAQA